MDRKLVAQTLRQAAHTLLAYWKDPAWQTAEVPDWLYRSKFREPLWHASRRYGLRMLRPDVKDSGDEGEYGIYLAPRARSVEVYGPRLYKVYANIRKPVIVKDTGAGKLDWMEETFGHSILTKDDVRKLKSQGYDTVVVTKSDIAHALEVIMFDSDDVFVAAEY